MTTQHSTKNPFYEEEDKAHDKELPKIDLKPTLIILVCSILGLGLGIGLADGRGSVDIVSWIKLPGDLFIRALKGIVLPLVFVNIILASVDMFRAGKAGSVAVKTIGLYLLTTFFASLIGLMFVLVFKASFEVQETDGILTPEIRISCPFNDEVTQNETFLTELNGEILCSDSSDLFKLGNPNGFILETGDPNNLRDDISFSQTLQDGIFRKLVSDNIVGEFRNENFAGIIVFAIIFGVASQKLKSLPKIIIVLLEELNRIFILIIDWIIMLTPFAVFSLIAGNIGEQNDLGGTFSNLGIFCVAVLMALAVHLFVFYPIFFFLFTKRNPFSYMKFMFPAQFFAFASSSSAATLPLTLDCVAATGEVPTSVANFVLSMGSTINMDGGAIYFPAALCFIAIAEGRESELDAAKFFLMILLSTIGSAGTAPIPSAGQVLIVTAYNTVFDTTGIPQTFSLILAIDWLLDRFRTVVNVTGDAFIARIVAEVGGVVDEDDKLLHEAIEGEERIVSLR